jgi:antirestriction protein ArdC
MKPRADIYQTVTDTIIAAIEAGQTAEKWRMPWNGFDAVPVNGCTNKHYRGINVPMLWAFQMESGYRSGIWASYKQWQEKGAQVRKGEKGAPVVFWKTFEIESEEEDEEAETRMFARYSTVFNADQVDGFDLIPQEHRQPIERNARADAFTLATGADIRHGFGNAFYRPSEDFIGLPDADTFQATETSSAEENYYATLFHELTHWSGAAHRLNREKGRRFGDPKYAFEELVAELGSAMLGASLSLTSSPRADHAQYIDGWLKALKDDKKCIFSAASQAQKAVDYLTQREESAAA